MLLYHSQRFTRALSSPYLCLPYSFSTPFPTGLFSGEYVAISLAEGLSFLGSRKQVREHQLRRDCQILYCLLEYMWYTPYMAIAAKSALKAFRSAALFVWTSFASQLFTFSFSICRLIADSVFVRNQRSELSLEISEEAFWRINRMLSTRYRRWWSTCA